MEETKEEVPIRDLAPKFLMEYVAHAPDDFVFECSRMWHPALRKMCLSIEELNNEYADKKLTVAAISIIREKFELVVYYHIIGEDVTDATEKQVAEFKLKVMDIIEHAKSVCEATPIQLDTPIRKLAPTFLADYDENTSDWEIFQCGQGWHKILREMCEGVEAVNAKYASQHIEAVEGQIKSKFAELRVYWRERSTTGKAEDITLALRDEFQKAVEEVLGKAELKCEETCEKCGAKATRMTDGWWMHVCDDCYRKIEEARGREKRA